MKIVICTAEYAELLFQYNLDNAAAYSFDVLKFNRISASYMPASTENPFLSVLAQCRKLHRHRSMH